MNKFYRKKLCIAVCILFTAACSGLDTPPPLVTAISIFRQEVDAHADNVVEVVSYTKMSESMQVEEKTGAALYTIYYKATLRVVENALYDDRSSYVFSKTSSDDSNVLKKGFVWSVVGYMKFERESKLEEWHFIPGPLINKVNASWQGERPAFLHSTRRF